MAPTKGKRTSLRTKASKPIAASNANSSDFAASSDLVVDTPFSSFRQTKKDKREMKHSLLMSKVTKSATTKKRRRPNKKLVTTLESLADALPDADDDGAEAGGEDGTVEVGQAKIKHKSLKSRPGALKRKEKLERLERQRFEKNLALMSAGHPQAPQEQTQEYADMGNAPPAAPTANRWSALRSFIENTMEKKKEFASG
ncbi:putative fringe-like protein [Neofusicoccum parvum UCRNP2]|uniref:Ribosome biogenesis protein SLX9 n=1 Tax=Botryosphaeria parva (strain UCR-NP2) TaxID=1287680 RepID=R1EJV7_BOTPV|nr:putative fringe-like protein [Neofusicoccum parvum UCRNP2]